jgi:hypothetical protein
MAIVATGGALCFQVNQPYTAAATMAECNRIESAYARQRPLGGDRFGDIDLQRFRFGSGGCVMKPTLLAPARCSMVMAATTSP